MLILMAALPKLKALTWRIDYDALRRREEAGESLGITIIPPDTQTPSAHAKTTT